MLLVTRISERNTGIARDQSSKQSSSIWKAAMTESNLLSILNITPILFVADFAHLMTTCLPRSRASLLREPSTSAPISVAILRAVCRPHLFAAAPLFRSCGIRTSEHQSLSRLRRVNRDATGFKAAPIPLRNRKAGIIEPLVAAKTKRDSNNNLEILPAA